MKKEHETDFEGFLNLIKRDPVSFAAYCENDWRHKIAKIMHQCRESHGHTLEDVVRITNLPKTQVLRAFHEDLGGALHIKTIATICNLYNLELSFDVKEKKNDHR